MGNQIRGCGGADTSGGIADASEKQSCRNLFDSKRETFRFRAGKLKAGSYVLVLKVTDAAGNTGSGDVVFTVPAKK